MKTHIVAIFNHLDGHNKLHCIVAENEVEAVKKALVENCDKEDRTEDYCSWVEACFIIKIISI